MAKRYKVALGQIVYDGKRYLTGEELPKLRPDSERELLKLKVIAEVVAAAVDKKPPAEKQKPAAKAKPAKAVELPEGIDPELVGGEDDENDD